MSLQVVLTPSNDSRQFLRLLPELLNSAQRDFEFRLHEEPSSQSRPGLFTSVEIDETLQQIYSLKNILRLENRDLIIKFINQTLSSKTHAPTNLFLAGSDLNETPPRVAAISTMFIRRHILPADPTYLTQRHAFYHLVVCCIAGAFLDLQPHEDRGCLLDFNSYTPNIRHKIDAGYSFCEVCSPIVESHPLGAAVLMICDTLKANDFSQPVSYKYRGRKKIFLCYAGADRSKVLELYDRLFKDGFEPWMDKKNLIGGQDWQLEIQRAIKSSDYFVACLSQNFQQRTYGHKEIKLALEVLDTMPEGSIYLIPVRLAECSIESRLAGRQWVDIFEPDGYEMLVRSLRWTEADAF